MDAADLECVDTVYGVLGMFFLLSIFGHTHRMTLFGYGQFSGLLY